MQKSFFSTDEEENHSFTNHTHVELLENSSRRKKLFPEGLAIICKSAWSWTILLLTQKGFMQREIHADITLILGSAKDTTIVVSSESRPFSLLGCTIVRDVLPGEIVFSWS